MATEQITLPHENPFYIKNKEWVDEQVTNRPIKNIQANVQYLRDKIQAAFNNASSSGDIGSTGVNYTDSNGILANSNFYLPTGLLLTDDKVLTVTDLETGKVYYLNDGYTKVNNNTIRFQSDIPAPVKLQFSLYNKRTKRVVQTLQATQRQYTEISFPDNFSYIPGVNDLIVCVDGIEQSKALYNVSLTGVSFVIDLAAKRIISITVV